MIEVIVGGCIAIAGMFAGYMISQASAKEDDSPGAEVYNAPNHDPHGE